MKIRDARDEDVPMLLAMYEWLFAPPGSVPPGWDPERAEKAIREAVEQEDSAILVAQDGHEPIGFCSAYMDLNSVRYGPRCWVEDLAVHPDRRSQGIGKALLDAARSWAADHGATHLELDSGDARTDAHRFYERERPAWSGRQFTWMTGRR